MKKYDSLNSLKVLMCIGIVLMHVRANTNYNIDGYVYNMIIPFFTNFTLLFMVLSAFGMCCGYYDKIKNNKISPKEFYSKRIKRILPFFAIVTLIEVVFNHDIKSMANGLFNITLTRGLIPEYENGVIGVGWFLGTVFLFYMVFPFFVYLLDNKKKAWIALSISILLNIICIKYVGVGRANLLYSFPYFVLGGIIYLYKDEIIKFFSNKKLLSLLLLICLTIAYFVIPSNKYLVNILMIILFAAWLIYFISNNNIIINNKVFNYISQYTLQIFLCHMIAFRLFEKLKLLYIFNNEIINYIFVSTVTLVGAFIFSYIVEYIFKKTKVTS